MTSCYRCTNSAGHHPFVTHLAGTLHLCPKCAGQLCREIVRYITGLKRDGLWPKAAPKNPKRPRLDTGTARCRRCEMQLVDWKPGDSPYCGTCQEGT